MNIWNLVPTWCQNSLRAPDIARVVLSSHGVYTRGSLLCRGTRKDHQRDSGWIKPLEATALSADEEAEAQTPVSLKGNMNRVDQYLIVYSVFAGGDAGAP